MYEVFIWMVWIKVCVVVDYMWMICYEIDNWLFFFLGFYVMLECGCVCIVVGLFEFFESIEGRILGKVFFCEVVL